MDRRSATSRRRCWRSSSRGTACDSWPRGGSRRQVLLRSCSLRLLCSGGDGTVGGKDAEVEGVLTVAAARQTGELGGHLHQTICELLGELGRDAGVSQREPAGACVRVRK